MFSTVAITSTVEFVKPDMLSVTSPKKLSPVASKVADVGVIDTKDNTSGPGSPAPNTPPPTSTVRAPASKSRDPVIGPVEPKVVLVQLPTITGSGAVAALARLASEKNAANSAARQKVERIEVNMAVGDSHGRRKQWWSGRRAFQE